VLIYAPEQGRYVGPYIEDGLHGVLPVSIHSDHRGFTIHELDENGKPVPVEYEAIRTDASHLRVRRLSPKIIHKRPPGKGKAKSKG